MALLWGLFPSLFLIGQVQQSVFEGIEVGFEMAHVSQDKAAGEFMEGDHVTFRFTIRDTLTGKGISGASPGAWMEPASKNSLGAMYDCGQLITSFLSGSMFSRAELDLNVYYVLALNDDATITVVDPLFGFGGTKLLALVELESTGLDWEVSPDQEHLFISQPRASKVAMVSTSDWTVTKQIPLNAPPYSLVMQPDGHYLWVEFRSGKIEGYSGVAAISTKDGSLVTTIPTGSGNHSIVLSDDSRWAFVSNANSGSLSVIDVHTLKKVKDLDLGGRPQHLAWSSKSKSVYVVDAENGTIHVIDGQSHQLITRTEAFPGASQIAFEPEGRFAFLIYPESDRIQILDAASNRIVQTGDTDPQPSEVSFSDELAYITHANSESVWMVPLDQIGKEGTPIQAADFPGGQNPVGERQMPGCGSRLVQAPGANAVLVANPGDKTVYYYLEGMAAPMGNFSNYNREPRSVAVIDRSLNEVEPGVYETKAQLRGAGPYRIPFFMDAPRIIHCFDAQIAVNPVLEAERDAEAMGKAKVEMYRQNKAANPGKEIIIYAEMVDPVSGEALSGLEDVRFQANSTSNWFGVAEAKESETKGLYEAVFSFPEEGVYYIYTESPSRKLTFNNPDYLILVVN